MNQRPLSYAAARALGIVGPQAAPDKLARQQAARKQVRGGAPTGDVKAPAYEVSNVFSYQSYFDSTLLEKALFRQNVNEPIVASTLSEAVQTNGYGLALHPSSETPVAVQFMTGAQQGASTTYRLKPGEVIRPQGTEMNEDGSFSGFYWGLPFGWLGGGAAMLVVLRSPDSRVEWASEHAEVAYHRIRLQIVAPAALPVAAGAYSGALNWPQRFPWPAATFGTSGLSQRGQPALSIAPTRTALSLRLATVTIAGANTAAMRMYWVGADVWAQSGPNAISKSTISLADVRATDLTWNQWAQQGGAPAPFNAAYQTLMLTGEAERYAANAGALVLASEDAQLQGQYVDIVRWGRL